MNLKKISAYTLALVLILFGIWMLKLSYNFYAIQKELMKWPMTSATVIEHNLYSLPAKANGPKNFACIYTYQYIVDNQKLISKSDSTPYGEDMNFFNSEIAAFQDCQTRPLKSTLTIYYNPQNKIQTLTKKRIDNGDSILTALVGMFALLAGIGSGFIFNNKFKQAI